MVKSYHTEEAIKNVVPIIKKGTMVLTLQRFFPRKNDRTSEIQEALPLAGRNRDRSTRYLDSLIPPSQSVPYE